MKNFLKTMIFGLLLATCLSPPVKGQGYGNLTYGVEIVDFQNNTFYEDAFVQTNFTNSVFVFDNAYTGYDYSTLIVSDRPNDRRSRRSQADSYGTYDNYYNNAFNYGNSSSQLKTLEFIRSVGYWPLE